MHLLAHHNHEEVLWTCLFILRVPRSSVEELFEQRADVVRHINLNFWYVLVWLSHGHHQVIIKFDTRVKPGLYCLYEVENSPQHTCAGLGSVKRRLDPSSFSYMRSWLSRTHASTFSRNPRLSSCVKRHRRRSSQSPDSKSSNLLHSKQALNTQPD